MKLSQKPLIDVLDLALTKNLTFTSLNNIKTLVKMDRTKNVFKYISNINLSFTMLF